MSARSFCTHRANSTCIDEPLLTIGLIFGREEDQYELRVAFPWSPKPRSSLPCRIDFGQRMVRRMRINTGTQFFKRAGRKGADVTSSMPVEA
ncbi:hypothetical protein U9M48_011521 [Paspalum notatum var. saurae]|uniref:Uncharacterized protein n=1 Tax=Paspalum notatum var. saurae TaxID=547442 RepID=A0AAQ3SVW3_PASNO